MQSKNLALLALSATAAVASPFHRRAVPEYAHHHLHRTGSDGVRPTGTGTLFPAGNDTNGIFAPTGSASVMPITMTVSPLPETSGSEALNTFANVVSDSSSSCVSSSVATETSVNLVTVTASAANKVQAAEVSAGAFYGQGSKTWGQSSAAATSASASKAVSTGNPSTTFASVQSAAKTSDATGSASASKSTSASASATLASTTGSTSGKRGISYNTASLVSAFGSSVSWAYNWGATADGNPGVEFVPMMWGQNDVSSFASQVGSATHVLSFNEPDLGTQSNIDPQTAAQLHKEGMADLVGKVQIGSPAVTNGATTSPPLGVNWLSEFFTACGTDCPVDFVAYHWYATADSFEYFKQHTEDIIAVAKNNGVDKVWLTEFEPSGSADAQASFMTQAVAYLDSNPSVERYAAFMASDGTMLSGTSLNSVGSAYADAS